MKNKKAFINETAISKIKTDTNSETMVRLNAKTVYHSFLINSIYTHKKEIKIMRTIKTFNHNELGKLRIVEVRKGENLFCGDDILRILKPKYPKEAIERYCKEGVKISNILAITQNQFGKKLSEEFTENYITFNDMIALILSSKKDVALTLDRWVNHNLTPLINTHGLNNASLLWDTELAMVEVMERANREKPFVDEFGELVE